MRPELTGNSNRHKWMEVSMNMNSTPVNHSDSTSRPRPQCPRDSHATRVNMSTFLCRAPLRWVVMTSRPEHETLQSSQKSACGLPLTLDTLTPLLWAASAADTFFLCFWPDLCASYDYTHISVYITRQLTLHSVDNIHLFHNLKQTQDLCSFQ